MKHEEVLSGVELLLALDRTRSATRAASELSATTATVLRRLERLEEELGTRLFDRLPTGLRPTPALALVRPWAEQASAAASGLLRQLTQVEELPTGVVRLAVPPAVATLLIVPALPALRAAFPDLVLELVPATALVDLATREADVALRTVRPSSGELVAQRVGVARLGVFGGRKLKPLEAGSRRLADYPWLGWDSALAHIPEAQWLTQHVPEARVVFRASELSTLLAAAKAGVGALVVADALAARAGLEPLDARLPAMPETSLWLVTHQALRPVPRVAAVWDWLLRQLRPRR